MDVPKTLESGVSEELRLQSLRRALVAELGAKKSSETLTAPAETTDGGWREAGLSRIVMEEHYAQNNLPHTPR